MTEMVKLATARELVDAGAVKQAEVIGLPGGWTVQLQTYNHARVLATKANEPRRFGTFESALKVLRDLGFTHLDEPFDNLLTQGKVLKDGSKIELEK